MPAANHNREESPWLVGTVHRSIYCSCDADCDHPAGRFDDAVEGHVRLVTAIVAVMGFQSVLLLIPPEATTQGIEPPLALGTSPAPPAACARINPR